VRLSDIHLVTQQLLRSTDAEVSETEALLGTRFPPGFRKWMTTLGAGVLCDLVRVYPIPDLLVRIAEHQTWWREAYFWDEGRDVLPQQAVLESVVVADTLSSDQVIFHPANPAGCTCCHATRSGSTGLVPGSRTPWSGCATGS
jgi:hypothetical protein